ncbi:hypothetical protein [Bifidobacterium simiiventris]|uniref:hypothetical protein n=1 Tax=Bifidobacterium simiiventris TaxID=2834434 RepID=UPI001C58542F|nr:hypothetical protein [Bifidobacterium simiiventris]MBW3078585.1 hypothetical protein [Bifidobacterium simiiventris]
MSGNYSRDIKRRVIKETGATLQAAQDALTAYVDAAEKAVRLQSECNKAGKEAYGKYKAALTAGIPEDNLVAAYNMLAEALGIKPFPSITATDKTSDR